MIWNPIFIKRQKDASSVHWSKQISEALQKALTCCHSHYLTLTFPLLAVPAVNLDDAGDNMSVSRCSVTRGFNSWGGGSIWTSDTKKERSETAACLSSFTVQFLLLFSSLLSLSSPLEYILC